jgi:hypothetical protein
VVQAEVAMQAGEMELMDLVVEAQQEEVQEV